MSAFTVVNQTQPGFDPSSIFTALFGGTTGITFDPATFAMVNGPDSVAFYDGSLGLGVGAGLLITSGTIPGTSNTAGYFGVSNEMPGDAMLNQVVNTVFATQSYDATTIGFSFTVDDPSITGVSFNIVFGSDEYPEWVNQFVDIAAIWVNGQDVAYFNNDPNAPLSVIGSNLSSNYFINNTTNLTTSSFGGVARPGVASLLPIEYDGVSAALTVFAPVHQGVNTLRIGIADTGDHIYDSGLFISNMRGTAIPVTGITRDIDGGGNNDLLQGSEDPEYLQGQYGDDDLRGGGSDDVLHGDAGDDFLEGDSGNDALEGGLGSDVATYTGNAADYLITNNGDGTFTIADQRLGAPDGTDRLIGVEIAQFADIALDIESMTEVARHTAPDAVAPPAPTPVVLPVTTGPAASGPVLGNATEDGASVSLDALANLGGFDPAATLTITDAPLGVDGAEVEIEGPDEVGGHGLTGGHDKAGNGIIGAPDSHTGIDGAEDPTGEIEPVETEMENEAPVVGGGSYGFSALPPGVTFDAASHNFTLDPANAAYQYLAAGQQAAVTIHYGVTDGTTTIPASVVFTVTGTNDAPVVTGVIGPLGTHEDGGARGYSQMGLLRNVTDVDFKDKLTAVISEPLPEGVFAVDLPEGPGLMIDPANASFQSLAQGEEQIVQVHYTVTDGTVSVDDMAEFRVVGTNDAPVVTGPVTAVLGEDDAGPVSLNALANASDVDHGAVLSITRTPGSELLFSGDSYLNEQIALGLAPETYLDPATLPAGVIYDALHGVYTFDPNDPTLKGVGVQHVRTVTDHYNPNNIAPAPSDASADESALPVNRSLPPGITFDAATNSFVLDPTNPAIQAIPAGQLVNMIIGYGVSDGITTTAASVSFAITGANDAPVVSGPLVVNTAEDSSGLIDRATLLSIATDIDVGDRLSLSIDETALPEHVAYNHVDGSLQVSTLTYYGQTQTVSVPAIDTLSIDASAPEFQSLAEGETRDVIANYSISDGAISVPAQVIFHVVGANDAPVVTAPVTGAAIEDSAPITVSGLANASDVDHGAILSVVAAPPPPSKETENFLNGAGVLEGAAAPIPILPFDPATLPAGVTFDAASNSFTLDPSNAAYQSLAAGQTTSVTIDYGVSDGIVATAASLTFTVTGTNDAPVASGPVTGRFVNEDGLTGAYDLPALLSTTTDVDQGDKLSIIVDTANLPAGVSYVSTPESVIPGHTTPAFVIPAGPRGTSWGGYIYPAQFVPAVVVPDQIVPATSTLSINPSDASFQSLAQGEEAEVVVHYQVTDGQAVIPMDAVFTVNGMNDAPVVAGAVTAGATEGGASVTISALANATDVDHGTVLHVMSAPLPPVLPAIGVGPDSPQDLAEATALAAAAPLLSLPFDPATLPAGVTYDPITQTFTLDPTDIAYDSLAAGQTKTVTVHYGVSDGITTTAASAVFTVTGTNDTPIVSATPAYAAAEDGAAITLNPLGNVSDVDATDVLKVVPGPLPDGVRLITVPGGYYQPDITITTFNPGASAFQSLAEGEVTDVVWNYQVTDGHVTVADSMRFTVTGVNDAPAMTGLMTAVVNEDGAGATIDGLSKVVDVDHGSSITLVDVPLALPAGVTYDAATHSFSIDPTDVAYQALAQGEMQTVSVAYGVSDGLVTSAAHVDFTVIGANDAPVVTGPTTGSPNEDGNVVTVKALGNASDIDGGHGSDGLMVTGIPTTLPAGVSYDAAIKSFSLDPTNAAYQSLSLGENAVVEIPYVVSDGYVDVPTSVVFTVSGRNDLPTVSGAVQGGTVTPQAGVVSMNLLATASDVDHLDVLAVAKGGGSNPTATITSGAWKSPIAFSVSGNTLTVDPKQFATLAAGTSLGLAFNYIVTDGNQGVAVPASAALTIQGTYAGPSGVSFAPATASLAKAQTGGGINSKTPIATIAQVGGLAADSYSYSLGGAGAASFTLATASGTTSLQTGTSPAAGAAGAAGGRLYALSVTATDTTAGISAPASPLNVVVGQGSGSGTINLAALPSMITAAPTFVYDLGGADQVNGAGMTGKLFINGGARADTMTGGAGATTYLYGATTDSTQSAMDIITNFHSATDLIDLTGLGKALSVGALASGATSVGGSSVGWTTSGGNSFVYVNTASNAQALGSAAMKIELLGTPTLAPANFAHV